MEDLLSDAKSSFSRGNYQKAYNLFSQIADSSEVPTDILADTYFHLANIFHIRGDLGRAIKSFNKVIEIDPQHTDASISLSVLYNDIGNYDDGEKIFKATKERVQAAPSATFDGNRDVHINKKFALKHYDLGEMYLTYGRLDEALFEYNKVVALDPEQLEARIKIAKVYACKGFASKALDELTRIKREHPKFMPARVALGIFHYGRGDVIKAQSEWQMVLDKEPNNQEAKSYLELSSTATETLL